MKTQNRNKLQATSYKLQGKWQSGQILLILVMIIAIAITIVLTISFATRTDTQVTKLEEDSQKALVAAQAGIEKSLKDNATINIATLGPIGTIISTGSASISIAGANIFTSPKIVSGEAYTAYLGTYTAGSPPTYAASDNSAVTICFGDTSSRPALDIAILKSSSVLRYIADPSPAQFGGSNKLQVTTCSVNGAFAYSVTIPQSDISNDSRLLVIRSMFASTRLLIFQTNLPAQGRTVTSQATTSIGVTKKVQLFQSYPQIPAEFFFTTF